MTKVQCFADNNVDILVRLCRLASCCDKIRLNGPFYVKWTILRLCYIFQCYVVKLCAKLQVDILKNVAENRKNGPFLSRMDLSSIIC